MQEERTDLPEDDEELVLPEEDQPEEGQPEERQPGKQKVDLPGRSKGSPLLRRVIGGDVREKWSDEHRKGEERGSGRGRVRREISPRQADEPRDRAPAPGSASDGAAGGEVGLRRDLDPNEGAPVAGKGDGDTPVPTVAEVFTKTAEEAAPEPGRRRRRKVKLDQEDEWQDGGRSSLWWLGGGLLCVLLVTASVFVMLRRGGFGSSEPGPPSKRDRFEVTETTPYESLPIAEFVASSTELLPVVREIVVEVESGAEGTAELLRGGEASLERMKEWRKRYPAPSPFREEGLHEIHASGNANFAYVVMTGEREDFSLLTAYFVKEDGRMLLDWEATEGYSEVLLDEVGLLKDGVPRMMRAVINLSNFYTDVYPEEKFRCYTLHHDDPGEWLWAYATRDSEVDYRLLGHMQMMDPLGRSRRVTVRITKKLEESRANQVEIEELMFGGWIEEPAVDEEG